MLCVGIVVVVFVVADIIVVAVVLLLSLLSLFLLLRMRIAPYTIVTIDTKIEIQCDVKKCIGK